MKAIVLNQGETDVYEARSVSVRTDRMGTLFVLAGPLWGFRRTVGAYGSGSWNRVEVQNG